MVVHLTLIFTVGFIFGDVWAKCGWLLVWGVCYGKSLGVRCCKSLGVLYGELLCVHYGKSPSWAWLVIFAHLLSRFSGRDWAKLITFVQQPSPFFWERLS